MNVKNRHVFVDSEILESGTGTPSRTRGERLPRHEHALPTLAAAVNHVIKTAGSAAAKSAGATGEPFLQSRPNRAAAFALGDLPPHADDHPTGFVITGSNSEDDLGGRGRPLAWCHANDVEVGVFVLGDVGRRPAARERTLGGPDGKQTLPRASRKAVDDKRR
jgi:hypothetical protein